LEIRIESVRSVYWFVFGFAFNKKPGSGTVAGELWGLIGAAFGAAVTLLSEWWRRKWDSAERQRDEQIRRAEELAGFAAQLYEWQTRCLSLAFDGRVEPPPSLIFRMGVLVSSYFPSVEVSATEIGKAVGRVHHACAEVAFEINRDASRRTPPLDKIEIAKGAMLNLTKACAEFSEQIGRLLKQMH
jgi:hypothetical protein